MDEKCFPCPARPAPRRSRGGACFSASPSGASSTAPASPQRAAAPAARQRPAQLAVVVAQEEAAAPRIQQVEHQPQHRRAVRAVVGQVAELQQEQTVRPRRPRRHGRSRPHRHGRRRPPAAPRSRGGAGRTVAASVMPRASLTPPEAPSVAKAASARARPAAWSMHRPRIVAPSVTPAPCSTSAGASHGRAAICPAAGQFRHEAADIVAVGVEFLALQHRVEDAEIGRGVGAASPRPTASSPRCWRGRHRPACPRTRRARPASGCSRCFTRNDATIMRTRLCIQPVLPELAHAGIDDRDSRCGRAARPAAARRPAATGSRRSVRRSGGPAGPAVRAGGRRIRATAAPPGRSRSRNSAGWRAAHRMPDLARRDFAPVQMRREAGGALGARRVALRRIAGDGPAMKRARRACAPASPGVHSSGNAAAQSRLAGQRVEAETVQPVARRRGGDGAQPGRRGQRQVGLAHRRHRLGEGRVDRIGLAAAAHDPRRLPQHRGGGAAAAGCRRRPVPRRRGGRAPVPRAGRGGRPAPPARRSPCARAGMTISARPRTSSSGAPRAARSRPSASSDCRSHQRDGSSRRPGTGRGIVQHEDRQQRPVGHRMQRGIVGEAKVLAEPEQGGAVHGLYLGRPGPNATLPVAYCVTLAAFAKRRQVTACTKCDATTSVPRRTDAGAVAFRGEQCRGGQSRPASFSEGTLPHAPMEQTSSAGRCGRPRPRRRRRPGIGAVAQRHRHAGGRWPLQPLPRDRRPWWRHRPVTWCRADDPFRSDRRGLQRGQCGDPERPAGPGQRRQRWWRRRYAVGRQPGHAAAALADRLPRHPRHGADPGANGGRTSRSRRSPAPWSASPRRAAASPSPTRRRSGRRASSALAG